MAIASSWVPGGTTHPFRNSRVGLLLDILYKEVDENKGRGSKPIIMDELFVRICDRSEDYVLCCSCPRWIRLVPRKNGIGIGLRGSRSTRFLYI